MHVEEDRLRIPLAAVRGELRLLFDEHAMSARAQNAGEFFHRGRLVVNDPDRWLGPCGADRQQRGGKQQTATRGRHARPLNFAASSIDQR